MKGHKPTNATSQKMMEGWGADAKEIAQKGSLNLTFDCIYLIFEGHGGLGVGTKHKTRPFALLPFWKREVDEKASCR